MISYQRKLQAYQSQQNRTNVEITPSGFKRHMRVSPAIEEENV